MSWKGYVEDHRPDQYMSAIADANGQALDSIGPCPEGFCWYVERMTCWSNTAVVASTLSLEVYSQRTQNRPNDNSKQGRQDVVTGPLVANDVSDERAPIYVGPGYFLVGVWSGLNVNDLVALSTQIRVHRLEVERFTGHHSHMEDEYDQKEPHAQAVVVPDEVAAV